MTEIWRDIKSYEGLYQVSNLGKVKSIERVVTNNKHGGVRVVKETILHPTDNGHGYKIIGLRKDGHRKNFYIHRLVATAFIPNPTQAKYINHIDYNRENNKINNLEWCTQRENINHSRENMRKPKSCCRPSNTGHKYVYFRNGTYRVCTPRNTERRFKTLEQALEFKEVVLNGR